MYTCLYLYFYRMDDSRILKRTFYGQLENGLCRHGGQLKRYKDNLKNILNQRGTYHHPT